MEQHIRRRLLIISQLFYPELISTGLTITELAEKLSGMGMEIEVLSGPPTIVDNKTPYKKTEIYHTIKITRVWGTRFPKLNLVGRIINQLTFSISLFFKLLFDRSKRPILVLTNPPFLAFACALLKILRIGKPYIYLVFDVYPDTAVNLGVIKANGFTVKFWELINKMILENAEKIIVIGRCMKEVIEKKMNKLKIDQIDKIKIIHVWSDDRQIGAVDLKKKDEFRARWKLKNKFVVLYSGNLGRFHDMETIMEAAKLLKDEREILFLIVGEGYKKQQCIDFAKNNNLDNCRFSTYVERTELPYLLSCASIGLVSLSKSQSGLSVPSKVYGLLAAGVPAVAVMSDSSEVAQLLKEERCGEVVENGNARGLADIILNLSKNQWLLSEYGKNGQQAIKNKYSLYLAAEQYYNILSSVK